MELIIRKMTMADLEPLYALLSDPQVMRFLEPPYSKEQAKAFLLRAGLSEPPLIYAVDGDGAFIGYVIYHDYDEDSVEIGWVLAPAHWGRGCASALTERMIEQARGCGKNLIIECAPEQTMTRHIALKHGFEAMGVSEGLAVFRRRRQSPIS